MCVGSLTRWLWLPMRRSKSIRMTTHLKNVDGEVLDVDGNNLNGEQNDGPIKHT